MCPIHKGGNLFLEIIYRLYPAGFDSLTVPVFLHFLRPLAQQEKASSAWNFCSLIVTFRSCLHCLVHWLKKLEPYLSSSVIQIQCPSQSEANHFMWPHGQNPSSYFIVTLISRSSLSHKSKPICVACSVCILTAQPFVSIKWVWLQW